MNGRVATYSPVARPFGPRTEVSFTGTSGVVRFDRGAGMVAAAIIVPGIAGAAPPVAPHLVTMQAQTDTVTLSEYTVGVPLSVQVLRGGVVIDVLAGVFK